MLTDPAPTADSIPGSASGLLRSLRWTRSSYVLLSLFFTTILLIVIVWWPLVTDYFSQVDPSRPIWLQLDRLLVGIFAFMSLMIMAGADIKADARILLVGLAGGLVIESWGTQTLLWSYYTFERPPLWIIPAWPIASLAIDRMFRLLNRLIPDSVRGLDLNTVFHWAYWVIMPAFMAIMIVFVWPTRDKSLTIMALTLCAFLVLSPKSERAVVLTFAAGSALGYFLEVWGTTRLCWTYYTMEQPPLFAVLAHGMAAVAFWRVSQLAVDIGSWTSRRMRARLPV